MKRMNKREEEDDDTCFFFVLFFQSNKKKKKKKSCVQRALFRAELRPRHRREEKNKKWRRTLFLKRVVVQRQIHARAGRNDANFSHLIFSISYQTTERERYGERERENKKRRNGAPSLQRRWW